MGYLAPNFSFRIYSEEQLRSLSNNQLWPSFNPMVTLSVNSELGNWEYNHTNNVKNMARPASPNSLSHIAAGQQNR